MNEYVMTYLFRARQAELDGWRGRFAPRPDR